MKQTRESDIYFEEPSQEARTITESEKWQEAIESIINLRMSALDKALSTFSPKKSEALRARVQEEAAVRVHRILGQQGDTDSKEEDRVAPPSPERLKKEERLRGSFLSAIDVIKDNIWSLAGERLANLYASAKDDQEREILKSWTIPVLHRALSRVLHSHSPGVFVSALEHIVWLDWIPAEEWSEVAAKALTIPGVREVLTKELVEGVYVPSHYRRTADACWKVGLGWFVNEIKPQTQEMGKKYLAQSFEKKDYAESAIDFAKKRGELVRDGIFTFEEAPGPSDTALALLAGDLLQGDLTEYARHRAKLVGMKIFKDMTAVNTHPLIVQAAKQYLVDVYAKPRFNFEKYAIVANKFVEEHIGSRSEFDAIPQIHNLISQNS